MIAVNRACTPSTQPTQPNITNQTTPHSAEALIPEPKKLARLRDQQRGQHRSPDQRESKVENGQVADAAAGHRSGIRPSPLMRWPGRPAG